eukprot:TRINITY_DN24433_c0_g1_i1.p1 TRINITY_DN24433_c0_g1~~TRINITY_DN24433_c0_g1_i1.p1  ORF type:complete len:371 (+),score=83.97 TRINITY_DN24433_c0_g1_i1:46-1158(+)
MWRATCLSRSLSAAPRALPGAFRGIAAEVDLGAAEAGLRSDGYALLRLGEQATASTAEKAARTLMGIDESGGGKYNAAGGVTRPTVEDSGFLNAAEGAPAELRIQPHNEMAYARQFPESVAFIMLRPSAHGGVTEIYDNLQLTRLLETSASGRVLLDKMRSLGMQYLRLLHNDASKGQPGFYSSWQGAFECADFQEALKKANAHPDAFADRCDSATCKYYSDAGFAVPEMRAVSWAPAMVTHPRVGELIFSSILNRHASWQDGHSVFGTLPLNMRPYQCRWGDGSELSDSEVSEIRAAHEACKIELTLKRGDLIVLDNLFMQHGRAPFTPGPEPRLMGLLLGKMMSRESSRSTPPAAFVSAREQLLSGAA